MTKKPDGEKIDELEKSATRQAERLDNTIASLDRLSAEEGKLEVIVHDIRRTFERELALLRHDIEALMKWQDEQKREEHARRAWAFGPNVVGAVVNVLLAALVAYVVSRR